MRRDGFLRFRDGFLGRRNGLLTCHSARWRLRRGGFLSITSTNAPQEEPDKQPQKQPYSERCEPYQDCPLKPYGRPPWASSSPSHRAIPSPVPYSHLPSSLEPLKHLPHTARPRKTIVANELRGTTAFNASPPAGRPAERSPPLRTRVETKGSNVQHLRSPAA